MTPFQTDQPCLTKSHPIFLKTLMFDTPSKLLFDENTIVSNVDVQHGDPLLPILFSLGIKKNISNQKSKL